jgi:hypothetical protein
MTFKENEQIVIELVAQQDSGWIKDGTQGKPYEEQLRAPGRFRLPSTGHRAVFQLDENGNRLKDKNGNFIRIGTEEIQYIEGQEELSVNRQREMGLLRPGTGIPHHGPTEIIINKGYRSVCNDYLEKTLFQYLTEVFWCENAEGRSPKATPFYRIQKQGELKEEEFEIMFAEKDAVGYCQELVNKVGGQYLYKEEKINGLCALFNIDSKLPAEVKLRAILRIAKNDPVTFLDKAKKAEEKTVSDVRHAVEMGLIRFNNGLVEDPDNKRVYYNLGNDALTKDKKITQFAEWLTTLDGKSVHLELREKINLAKEKSLK